jgi:hypothetical protein
MQTVAWIATRDPAIVQLASLHKAHSDREPEEMQLPAQAGITRGWLDFYCMRLAEEDRREEIEASARAIAELVEALRDEKLPSWEIIDVQDGQRANLGSAAWQTCTLDTDRDNPVELARHFVKASVGLDGEQTWPAVRREGLGFVAPRRLQFRRDDVLRLWPAPAPKPLQATIGAERRWRDWLVARMREAPSQPRSKQQMLAEGLAAGLPVIGTNAFKRAWGDAIGAAAAPAWRASGRRRKSARSISAPKDRGRSSRTS